MQLKFRRFNGSRGFVSKSTTYILDAIMLLTAEEQELLTRFGRMSASPWYYSDDEQRFVLDEPDEVYHQMTDMTFKKLADGVRFEFAKFNDAIRAENDLIRACKSVLSTCELLATFDGTERVVEITSDEASLVAEG